MRVIITGGTGLIGKALAAELASDYEVVILSRNPDKHRNDIPSSTKIVQWDAETSIGWGELADGAHAIINLAGASIGDKRWSKSRKQLIIDSRVNAGKAVVEAVARAKIKPQVVVQASAIGYYGARRDEILTEQSTAGSDFPAEVTKVWEPATASVKMEGVRQVIARIGVVLSMKGGALPQLVQPFTLFAGGPVGSGEQWMSWIHVQDVVRALRFLMENDKAEGVYNLTAPAPVRNEMMANKIGLILQKPALLRAPAFALKLALGEMATLALDGQRVSSKKLQDAGFAFQFADVETALRNVLDDQT